MYSQNLHLDRIQRAVLDGAVVFCAALAATWMRHDLAWIGGLGDSGNVPWSAYRFPSGLLAVTCVLMMHWQHLYTDSHSRVREALRITKAVLYACTLVLALSFFFRGYNYSRGTVFLFYPLCVVALISSRMLNRVLRRRIRANRVAARRVLIVGCGLTGRRIAQTLLENPGYYNLVGLVDDDRDKRNGALPEVPFLGTTEDLERVVPDYGIDEVIVAIPSATPERIMDLIGECLRLNVKWKVVPNLCNVMLDRIHIDHIGDLPLISLRSSKIVGFNWALKRSFDLTFASLVLIVLAPLNLTMAVLVKLTSSGPVLFKQTRVGLNGKPFTFLKFRSMRQASGTDVHRSFTTEWIYGRTGADSQPSAQINSVRSKEVGQNTHKLTNDRRITPFGWLLRSTSLDEMPQFWNVIRGEMSVVGPRPPVPYEVERYTEWHKRRLEVLPGITGLWQVNGRNSLSFDEMVRLDIKYIESWSMAQDVRIVLKTIPAMFFNRGH